MSHPTNRLDDVIHQRVRLGILTVAAEAGRVEFGFRRAVLELTAGNLSRHLSVLEEAGLVSIDKGRKGSRPRTWVTVTPAGRQALAVEIGTLKDLIRDLEAIFLPPTTNEGPSYAAGGWRRQGFEAG